MPKIKKKPPSRLPSISAILTTDCQAHRWIGRDGVCLTTDCLVRKGNVENYPGECRLYDRLLKKESK